MSLYRCQITCGHARGRFVGVAKDGAPAGHDWKQTRGWFVCPRCGRMWVALIALYRVRADVVRALVATAAGMWFIECTFARGLVEVIR